MPRDLFGDVTSRPASVGNRKWYTVPLAFAAHVFAIVPLVLVPLLASDLLPVPREYNVFVAEEPIPPDPPPAPTTREQIQPRPNPHAAPIDVPDTIQPEPPGQFEWADAFDSGVPSAVPGAGVVIGDPPPAPPTPAAAPTPQKAVHASSLLRAPVKTRDAVPIYPSIAQAARVQGTVILQATIAVDGKVQELRVLRSIPLLDQAALDAVRQWEYSPTTLNGMPVPVIMTVTVTFTLNRD
jgi:protein TonB